MSPLAGVRSSALVILMMLLAQLQAWSAAQQEVRGMVKDRSGAVIARAAITLHTDSQDFSQ